MAVGVPTRSSRTASAIWAGVAVPRGDAAAALAASDAARSFTQRCRGEVRPPFASLRYHRDDRQESRGLVRGNRREHPARYTWPGLRRDVASSTMHGMAAAMTNTGFVALPILHSIYGQPAVLPAAVATVF